MEIERKFLVRDIPDLAGLEGQPMVQGYLHADERGSVRVRIAGTGAFLTVKGPAVGLARPEFEYPIPAEDAREMLNTMCVGSPVEKVRYRIEHRGYTWELDVFSGSNAGLVLAEVELADAAERPPLPDWLGREVSGEPRYYNASLARQPYRAWTASSGRD